MNCVRFIKIATVAIALLPWSSSQAAVSVADMQRQAAAMRDREAKIWKEREASQRVELQKQEKAAVDAVARRNRADAHTKSLDNEWTQNDARITEFKQLLRQREGNLGELFGVTRQIAGDAAP